MFALILSGGVGTRLWPQSRKALPKQLLPLISERTMVQNTVDRILPIIAPENIFFATNKEYGDIIAAQLPEVPPQNIVTEPSAKNTAPCIGLSALHMRRLDPTEVMASLHADHFIANEEGFRQALLAAEEVARQGYLVTLGITPDKPETGYGYIHRGGLLGNFNGHDVYEVGQFLEKPNLETAQRFVTAGTYYWNSGIFIWQLSTLMDAFSRHTPQLFGQLSQIEQAIAAGSAIEPHWDGINPISIDVGILERAAKVAVIPVDFGWNDVGSWTATHEVAPKDELGNVVKGAHSLVIDSRNSYVQSSDRLVALVGLDDVVVVDTGDAVLVCARDKAQNVKDVVSWLQENNREDLL
ncbi:MAG: mannose-1-phosphate guanylyltransferase [Anaerolineae bacterium]